MAKDTEIAASDWLGLRDRVADKLRESSNRMEKPTAVRLAEGLLVAGWIDVQFIRAEDAAREAARKEREDAAKVRELAARRPSVPGVVTAV